jgi:4-hydroxybenzoate polyprenyltransferase/phosphoserine phosphatase
MTSTERAATASVWDLDGTLLKTDVFVESLLRLLAKEPWRLPQVAFWLMRGIGFCKGRVADLTIATWTTWPLQDDVAEIIEAARTAGRPVVLATAAHERVARQVAADLGFFDAVLATSDTHNMKGRAKRVAIREWLSQSACDRFSYAGDSMADLAVWQEADEVIVVKPSAQVESAVRRLGKPLAIVGDRRDGIRATVRALRPHQWAKNALLFVPMLLSHQLDVDTFLRVCIGVASFSMCASAIYVLNDLVDLSADREHPKKARRPFANGDLSIATGLGLVVTLFAGAVAVAAAFLPPAFLGILGVYAVMNLCYSTWLKRKPLLDVLVLAAMYALRVEAGGAAASVSYTPWLLAFSIFFFTSLAFAKRYTELSRIGRGGGSQAHGRGYLVTDVPLLEMFGVASGYVSVVVLALYMSSSEMRALYGDGRLLWLICPLVTYWLTRIWLLAHRGVLDEDPVLFAIHDRVSLLLGWACVLVVVLASLKMKVFLP